MAHVIRLDSANRTSGLNVLMFGISCLVPVESCAHGDSPSRQQSAAGCGWDLVGGLGIGNEGIIFHVNVKKNNPLSSFM